MYSSSTDPLCYPGTNVLFNKAGLKDQATLDEFETAMTLTRWEEPWPPGNLDYRSYLDLHRHPFQDVYEWAGRLREIRIGKHGNWFCYPEYIDREMKTLFSALKAEGCLAGLPPKRFAARAACYLAELNAIHPFRDGNGRTQMAFLFLLCERAGFTVRHEALDRDRVLAAMIESFAGEPVKLTALIRELITAAVSSGTPSSSS